MMIIRHAHRLAVYSDFDNNYNIILLLLKIWPFVPAKADRKTLSRPVCRIGKITKYAHNIVIIYY